jgi:branched-chain amino acid transport system substrate-binding protein
MVSEGTNPAMTIPEPGIRLKTLYPTGTRNLVRLTPRDDLDGVAGATFAKRLGLHRVYVWLESPDDALGSTMAPAFARAARRLGIQVIGPASPSRGFQRLGRRLAARGVDGVFVASYNNAFFPAGGLKFIRAMRETLGPAVTLIGPKDGFWLPPDASAADRVAQRGMYLVGADLSHPEAQLPPAGRAFVAAFRASPPVGANNLWAPYAAQATDVLLAAISRSDGTRASVVRELFRTRISGGIFGDFTVTPSGDIDPNLVIVDRTTAGLPGTKAVTTIRVPPNSG